MSIAIKSADHPAAVEIPQTVNVPLWYDEQSHEIRMNDTDPNAPELYCLVKRVFANIREPMDADALAALENLRTLIGGDAGNYAASDVDDAREVERRKTLQADADKVTMDFVEKYKDISETDGFNDYYFSGLCNALRHRRLGTEGLAYRMGLMCYLYGREVEKGRKHD